MGVEYLIVLFMQEVSGNVESSNFPLPDAYILPHNEPHTPFGGIHHGCSGMATRSSRYRSAVSVVSRVLADDYCSMGRSHPRLMSLVSFGSDSIHFSIFLWGYKRLVMGNRTRFISVLYFSSLVSGNSLRHFILPHESLL